MLCGSFVPLTVRTMISPALCLPSDASLILFPVISDRSLCALRLFYGRTAPGMDLLHLQLPVIPGLHNLITDNTSPVNGNHSFSHFFHNLMAVSDNHRRPPPVDLLQKSHDLHGIMGIQVSCGFIGQKNRRIVDQRPCDGHSLLLSSRKLVRIGFIF